MTLLIVEDDALALDGLSLFFKACNADVIAARTCARAASIIETPPAVDVLITTLSQSSCDGADLVTKVRQAASEYELRTVGVTDDDDQDRDVSGFDTFIHKPLKFDEVGKVAVALAESRRHLRVGAP